MTAEDIAKKLGRRAAPVRVMLKELRDAGKVESQRIVHGGKRIWVYRDEG